MLIAMIYYTATLIVMQRLYCFYIINDVVILNTIVYYIVTVIDKLGYFCTINDAVILNIIIYYIVTLSKR